MSKLVTPQDVRNAVFDSTCLGLGGYNELQVDDLLDDAAYTIQRLSEYARHLQRQLHQRAA